MDRKLNYAIIGNGNLGKACKQQILKRPDEFNLVGVFSQRESSETIPLKEIPNFRDQIDVGIFCGSSKGNSPAPEIVPWLTSNDVGISTVDSYDEHKEILNGNYQNKIRQAMYRDRIIIPAGTQWQGIKLHKDITVGESGTTAVIGAGWDPGILSIQRIYNDAIMPDGVQNTLYGGTQGGLSMGHTTALKGIPGVIQAAQFTFAREDATQKALSGKAVDYYDRHRRVCYVVTEPGANKADIEGQIRNMDGYYKDQLTEVHFITMEEFMNNFAAKKSHGGQVISANENANINFSVNMKSNPDFTASVMLAYGKATHKMNKRGMTGVRTVADVPPSYLMDKDTDFTI